MKCIRDKSFNGLAKLYQQARPEYPCCAYKSIFNFFNEKVKRLTPLTIADIGCGTGIATRALLKHAPKDSKIIGIEPCEDMIEQAVTNTSAQLNITYLYGNAEHIPLFKESVDIIIAAQAIQWFDRSKFYQEAKRVLKTNGLIVIMENNRNWQESPFLDDYEKLLEQYAYHTNGAAYSRNYRAFDYEAELKLLFNSVNRKNFAWSYRLNTENFKRLSYSSTQMQRAIGNVGIKAIEDKLKLLINKHFQQEAIKVHYTTAVYSARK